MRLPARCLQPFCQLFCLFQSSLFRRKNWYDQSLNLSESSSLPTTPFLDPLIVLFSTLEWLDETSQGCVECLWPLQVRKMTGTFDDAQPRARYAVPQTFGLRDGR
jgi:hypothetical protein